jgi:ubiquinone/menaquinone biosynthesis C-methylase UbiE
MNKIHIKNMNDLFIVLDDVFENPVEYWNIVYQERPIYMSFLTEDPDENLLTYFSENYLHSGRALELGCGEGRNAIYLAQQDCEVDAVDFSNEAIEVACKKAKEKNVKVNFLCENIFEIDLPDNSYEIVYDSGVLHHMLPHRRFQYIELINRVLKTNGYFGLVCFALGFNHVGGAEEISDYEVYNKRKMLGGMAYSEEKLQNILSNYFELIEIRYMKEHDIELFGKSFLWASLWRKK